MMAKLKKQLALDEDALERIDALAAEHAAGNRSAWMQRASQIPPNGEHLEALKRVSRTLAELQAQLRAIMRELNIPL